MLFSSKFLWQMLSVSSLVQLDVWHNCSLTLTILVTLLHLWPKVLKTMSFHITVFPPYSLPICNDSVQGIAFSVPTVIH